MNKLLVRKRNFKGTEIRIINKLVITAHILDHYPQKCNSLKSRVQVSERNSPKEYCSWQEVESLTRILANKIMSCRKKYDSILSITNGGIIPARLMARELDINYIQFIQIRNKKLFKEEMPLLNEEKIYLVIDEIYDTGNTFSQVYDAVKTFNCDFAFLISRYKEINSDRIIYVGKILNHNKWIVFPWE